MKCCWCVLHAKGVFHPRTVLEYKASLLWKILVDPFLCATSKRGAWIYIPTNLIRKFIKNWETLQFLVVHKCCPSPQHLLNSEISARAPTLLNAFLEGSLHLFLRKYLPDTHFWITWIPPSALLSGRNDDLGKILVLCTWHSNHRTNTFPPGNAHHAGHQKCFIWTSCVVSQH